MKIKHKVLSCGTTEEDCLSVAVCGRVDAEVMRELFTNIAEITESVGACPVLIDLRHGAYSMTRFEIYRLIEEFKPGLRLMNNRIALLSAPEIEHYDQLFIMSVYLLNQSVEADAFCQITRALEWLAQRRQPPVQH